MLVLVLLALLVGGSLQKPLEKSRNSSADSDYYDDYSEEEFQEGPRVFRHNATDFENYLVGLLDGYYDKYVKPPRKPEDGTGETLDIYEQMQSDQPVTQNINVNGGYNASDYSVQRM